MKNFNTDLEVVRGETFAMDYIIQNKDGSPYIINSRLSAPHFLISISNSKYAQKGSYVKRYWLSLSGENVPKFNSTVVVDLHSVKVSATSDEPKYNDFVDATASYPVSFVEGYVNGLYVKYNIDDAVFYIEYEDGHREYKYMKHGYGWMPYECRLIKIFTNADTSEWVEQSYVYNISLVSGSSTALILRDLCMSNHIAYSPDASALELYELLKANGIEVDINIDIPLQTFDVMMPIVRHSKISVHSNIKGV